MKIEILTAPNAAQVQLVTNADRRITLAEFQGAHAAKNAKTFCEGLKVAEYIEPPKTPAELAARWTELNSEPIASCADARDYNERRQIIAAVKQMSPADVAAFMVDVATAARTTHSNGAETTSAPQIINALKTIAQRLAE